MGWKDAPVVEDGGGSSWKSAPAVTPEPFVPSGEKTSGWLGGLLGYDPKALGITPAENIAGHPVTRFAMGAAAPFLGAAQLVSEAIGSKTVSDTLRRTDDLKRKGMDATGAEGTDVIGAAGTAVSPAALSIMKLAPAATWLGRAGQGSAVGTGFGLATPVTEGDSYWGSKATQAGTGALIGGAVPMAFDAAKGALKVGRDVADLFTEKGAGRILTRYQNNLVGDNGRTEVINALRNARQPVPGYDQTAAEVVSQLPAGSPLVAHQRITAQTAGGPSASFGQRIKDQKDALAKAVEARNTATAPMRDAALTGASIYTPAGGVQSNAVSRGIDATLGKPGIRASDVVSKTLNAVKEKIAKFSNDQGVIDPSDLYTIRKEIGNTIKTYSKETANWDKKLSAGLERDLQRAIDDAIEAAGGTGWKQYLSEYSAASKGIDAAKEGAKNAYRPPQRTNLGGGMNVAEETRLHLPNMLSRPMMLANAVMKRVSGGIEPRLDAEAARRYLNPQALADALGTQASPAQQRIVDAMLQRMGIVYGTQAAADQEQF